MEVDVQARRKGYRGAVSSTARKRAEV